ncbi:unnamed protein product [Dracunculus medinensis]|uniref:Tudor-knot domain-containing protein n=1 Tax=Dracunculus medinensis TaxID=318479 RepID=A0A0N4UCS9_DRAME|nr:unnamed protein product [Dracunculus medinensis]
MLKRRKGDIMVWFQVGSGWYGPSWLKKECKRSQCEFQAQEHEEHEEMEKIQWADVKLMQQVPKYQQFTFIDASRFSKWFKLIRVPF